MTATAIAPRTRQGAGGLTVSYDRISKLKEGDGAQAVEATVGTDRQYEDNTQAAEDFGVGPIERRYTDPDRSASEFRTREREDFDQLLEDIDAGLIAVLIVWVMDRIVRDGRDQERLFYLCRKHGVRLIQSGPGKELDLEDPDAITIARIQGAIAIGEVLRMSRRMRRRNLAAAKKGLPHGGRRRFGYESDGMTIVETEAEVFRDLATRFLAGETLVSLAKDLTARGVPTTQGGKWTGPNLRGLLGNPAYAGLKVHQGAVIGRAAWQGIIPEETHDEIVAKLADPDRRPKGTGNARRWLLPGLAVCDACGARIRVHHEGRRDRPVPLGYVCATGRHVRRPVAEVDRVVEWAMVERLTLLDEEGLLPDTAEVENLTRLRNARQAVQDRLDDYAEKADAMSPEAYGAATTRLQEKRDALTAQVKAAQAAIKRPSRVLTGATGEGAALAWFGPGGPDSDRAGGFSLARRRALIEELAEVRLVGGRRGNRFNPEDVVVRFRED